MPPQYIFTIENLAKAYAKKDVLKNIWLSFYPGAKIGVLGGNGPGKSTLLRIMAGVEKDFEGTARPASGVTIGYLPQEPTLAPSLDVRGNVEQAVAHVRGCSRGSMRSTPGSASRWAMTRWTSSSWSKGRSRTASRRR